MARRLGRSASEVGAELVGETLRRADFAFIACRSSGAGRQAYIQGTRLAVWQAIAVLRSFEGDVPKAAGHLHWPEAKMHAAVAYAKAFPDEIEEALQDNSSFDCETLSRLLLGIQRFEDFQK